MHGIGTIFLLIVSNIFMTFAWYGHLKLQQMKLISDNTPLYIVILISWFLALFEYACQVPANRIGFVGNGGAFTLMQLKVIQEVISIAIFTLFTIVFFKGETLQWNHLVAVIFLVLAVYFVFLK
jgi:uncharacterized protein (DUF486 family)